MIEIIKANQVKGSRKLLGEIYASAFKNDLIYFSTDEEKLIKAFKHMFNLKFFYIAIVDGIPAGMIACVSNEQSVKLNKKIFRKHFGFLKTIFAFKRISQEFEKIIKVLENEASIEFVGVKKEFQGKKVATAMIDYVLKSTNYSSFLIADVLDSNKPALRLYEKSGFIQTKRIKEKALILKRNKYRITLKYNK